MLNVVTGSFGYIGRYITRHLLDQGEQVRTVTTHPNNTNPFGEQVEAFPYAFDRPEQLVETLRGATTLYNTYWIRFEHGGKTFKEAVDNTAVLFNSAKQAGIQKIVHISVTQASLDSSLPYYRGKAQQEKLVKETGLDYCIIRPTLVFGKEDILVNNIAWLLRKFPVFPIFGDGNYTVQPIFVGDLAQIASECANSSGQKVIDAIGPDEFTYEELVTLLASQIKPDVKLIHIPPALGIALGKIIGFTVGDVILTMDEARGLMSSLLTSSQKPDGTTHFSEWLAPNKEVIGQRYTSELNRHFNWRPTSIN
jgi:uncharacterized protein YbjT (DUF2867 family)